MKSIKHFFKETTFGQWSLALFFVAVLSGIVLIIPYDASEPYRSVTRMLLVNPYASWVRNIHYYSSQLFVVMLIFHLYEHFRKKESIRLKNSVWFRLTLSLVTIFFVMFTGFLLRGDADTMQARQIAESLIRNIPFAGNLLAYSILGKQGSFQLIYINHVATFTIISLVFIFEHSRKIWPEKKALIFVLLMIFLISYYIMAPLHDNVHPTIKGPWYLVGLQELLHWFKYPQLLLLILLAVWSLIYLSGLKKYALYVTSRRILLYLTFVYGVFTIDGLFFRGENWNRIFPWEKEYNYQVFDAYHLNKVDFYADTLVSKISESPVINGRRESCLLCHDKVGGFTKSHNPKNIGCFSCHGGNPFSTNKKAAHANMILIPGNLSNAGKSCGTTNCHPEITNRVNKGLMATLSGMINVDRYVFNEQDSPDGHAGIMDLHHSAADEHLKTMCVRCHLGNTKLQSGPVTEESRGGGCLACHLNYDKNGLTAHSLHKQNPMDTMYLSHHAAISLNVSNDHCFGCHSRSGRISTNYEGWHETTLNPADVAGKKGYRLVKNSRVFKYVQDDVHHAAGMDCIDCHTSYELMGDGKSYRHQENQQDVACSDCHTQNPDTISPLQLDGESATIASMRFGNIAGKNFLRTKKHKVTLINTFVKHDSIFLIGKNNHKLHFIKAPSTVCQRDKAHKNVTCSACHTSWAPTCIGCHNTYDPSEPGYNMVLNQKQRGSWVEFVGRYDAFPPALGNRMVAGKKEVVPVIPGMVLTIDVKSYDKNFHDSLIFHRLFAPASPHTTMKEGRNCKSCHNNPQALGYGKGNLTFVITDGKGRWNFEPFYSSNKNDNLPEDAWIPFLGSRTGKVSTRSNLTPFTINDQKRILTVGACLTCHDENSKVMQQSLIDFSSVLNNRKSNCIMPEWK